MEVVTVGVAAGGGGWGGGGIAEMVVLRSGGGERVREKKDQQNQTKSRGCKSFPAPELKKKSRLAINRRFPEAGR